MHCKFDFAKPGVMEIPHLNTSYHGEVPESLPPVGYRPYFRGKPHLLARNGRSVGYMGRALMPCPATPFPPGALLQQDHSS
jgi:hypothetical protein